MANGSKIWQVTEKDIYVQQNIGNLNGNMASRRKGKISSEISLVARKFGKCQEKIQVRSNIK